MFNALTFATVAAIASRATAQEPLIQQRWPFPYAGPFRIDTSNGPRGLMQGYNQCNATTEGPESHCVNTIVNSPQDFCLYGLPELDVVGNAEGEAVAYCTREGYGTRLIDSGTITGLQVVKAPGYIAFGGYFHQQNLNIREGDAGGELDPHGADLRGNPIGSLMYSNAFSNNNSTEQVIQWHLFIGADIFCLKACDPRVPPNSNGINGNLCENRFDTVGCNANVPLNYAAINGTFSYCQGENQQVPNGEALPIPATSQCTTFASTELFPARSTSSSAAASSSSAAASSGATGAPSSATAAPTGANNAVSQATSRAASGATGVQVGATFIGAGLVAFAGLVGAAAVLL